VPVAGGLASPAARHRGEREQDDQSPERDEHVPLLRPPILAAEPRRRQRETIADIGIYQALRRGQFARPTTA
jgi:hypothetical protein